MTAYPSEDAARRAARQLNRVTTKFRYDVVMSPREQFFIAIIRLSDMEFVGFVR
jgi:hypothetical protein